MKRNARRGMNFVFEGLCPPQRAQTAHSSRLHRKQAATPSRGGLRGTRHQDLKKALTPIAHVMLSDTIEKGDVAPSPLAERHFQRSLHSVCHIIDIVRVHDKCFFELFGGSSKFRQYKNAWIVLILS